MSIRYPNVSFPLSGLRMLLCFILLSAGSLQTSAQCIAGNCSNGKGTYLFKDGSTYGGAFQNYFPHGFGKINYKNGNIYEGSWVRGKKSGQGTFSFKNGNQYKGLFQHDLISGYGIMTYSNGDMYAGEWQNNKPNGKGKYTFATGEFYDGEFASGKFHGKGIFMEKDGSRFEGTFVHGKREGPGKLFKTNGQVVPQKYKNHVLVWKETLPGDSFAADVENEKTDLTNCLTAYCHETIGFYTYGDGSRYEGPFENGQGKGEGICFYANGDRYVGEWAEHAPHGQGSMFTADGQKISGFWQKGEWIRPYTEDVSTAHTKPAKEQSMPQKKTPKMYALVVGVALYNHTKSLKYTDDDAYRIYAFLKSPEGGALPDEQITLLIDEAATRSSILTAMEKTARKAGPEDIIFVYLSGHGLQGTFVPHDFDGKKNLVTYQELFDKLDASTGKHKIFIADACHSGSMVAYAKAPIDEQIAFLYDQFEQTGSGTAFISSSKSEEVSLEHGGMRQGIFSHYLIRGLKGEANRDKDRIITVHELYNFLSSEVKKYTAGAQNPVLSGTFDPDMPVAMVRM